MSENHPSTASELLCFPGAQDWCELDIELHCLVALIASQRPTGAFLLCAVTVPERWWMALMNLSSPSENCLIPAEVKREICDCEIQSVWQWKTFLFLTESCRRATWRDATKNRHCVVLRLIQRSRTLGELVYKHGYAQMHVKNRVLFETTFIRLHCNVCCKCKGLGIHRSTYAKRCCRDSQRDTWDGPQTFQSLFRIDGERTDSQTARVLH